jgi:membrane-associated phospholipid phosphatase
MSEESTKSARLRRMIPWTTRGMIIRSGIALAIVLGSIATNRSFVGWGLFTTFAVFIVPVGRVRSFLFSFGPYAAVWFVFTALRSVSDETPFARTLNLQATDFERELFRGRLPTQTLQDKFYDPLVLHWYDYLTTAVHWSYFIVPHAVAIYLWHKHQHIYRRFLGGMILLLGLGLVIYFLIPSNPPWMAPEQVNSPSAPTPVRVMENIGEKLGGGIYQASYKVIGESNPIAAMPSIHMAITFLLTFPAFAVSKRWGLIMLTYSALMGYSLMYLGEHYFIDVLAGCMVAAYGWYTYPVVARLIWMARGVRVSSTTGNNQPVAVEPAGAVASPAP